MDNNVPQYGTNSMVSSSAGHADLFGMFHSFLGHFWGKDRTGMFGENEQQMSDVLNSAFPGIGQKFEDAKSMLSSLGQIMPGFDFGGAGNAGGVATGGFGTMGGV